MSCQLLIFMVLNVTTFISTSVNAQRPWAWGGYRPWYWGPTPQTFPANGPGSTPIAPRQNLTFSVNITGVNATALVDAVHDIDDVLKKAEEDAGKSCNWYIQNQIYGIRNAIWFNVNGVEVNNAYDLNFELFRLASIAEHGIEVTKSIHAYTNKKCGDVVGKVHDELKKLREAVRESHRTLLSCP